MTAHALGTELNEHGKQRAGESAIPGRLSSVCPKPCQHTGREFIEILQVSGVRTHFLVFGPNAICGMHKQSWSFCPHISSENRARVRSALHMCLLFIIRKQTGEFLSFHISRGNICSLWTRVISFLSGFTCNCMLSNCDMTSYSCSRGVVRKHFEHSSDNTKYQTAHTRFGQYTGSICSLYRCTIKVNITGHFSAQFNFH